MRNKAVGIYEEGEATEKEEEPEGQGVCPGPTADPGHLRIHGRPGCVRGQPWIQAIHG